MGRLQAGSNMKGRLFTILRNVWFNHLRKWRNGPQMIEIEVGDGAANSIAKPSTDSHNLYVSKMEAEQVRAAIQELPLYENSSCSRSKIISRKSSGTGDVHGITLRILTGCRATR
jgi:DNA-directed RNA polymerase specialized sigma24 family protein